MTGSPQPWIASPASAAWDGGIDRAPVPSAIRSRTWNSRPGFGEEAPEVTKTLAVAQRDHQAPVANRPVLAVAAEETGLFDRRAADGFGAGAVAEDREDPGGSRHAGQLDVAALAEADAGAGDEVVNRARDQDLSGGGQLDDAGPDVDGDAAHVGLDQLALAGVHPDAYRQPLRLGRVHDAEGASDGTGGAVEHRQDSRYRAA